MRPITTYGAIINHHAWLSHGQSGVGYLYFALYTNPVRRGIGHDVIKILNFSAIQCKFNCCLNNCNYRQHYWKIILLFQIRWCLSSILKSYWILFYKNIIFQTCVDSLHSSASGDASHLRLDGKFHTHMRTCSGLIDENQAKTHAFVSVAMFLFQDF